MVAGLPAGLGESPGQDEPGPVVAPLAAHDPAQPERRRLGVALEEQGPSQVEGQVRRVGLLLGRLPQEGGRPRRRAAQAERRDRAVVEDGRARLLRGEGPVELGRLPIAAEVQEGDPAQEAALPREGRVGADPAERLFGGLEVAGLEELAAEVEARLVVFRSEGESALHQFEAARRVGGGQPLRVGLEGFERQGPPRGHECLARAGGGTRRGEGDVPREGVDQRRQGLDRTGSDERRRQRPALQVEQAQRQHQLACSQLVAPDDQAGRVERLPHPDAAGPGRGRGGRDAEGLLRAQPVGAPHRSQADAAERPRKAVCHRLRDPRGVAGRTLRGHHHHRAVRRRGGREEEGEQPAQAGSSIRAGGRTQAWAANSLRSWKASVS